MSNTSTEPDKYSINDMMDRLKKRESEDQGELVTRADGTQALRRRKRRRRTEQYQRGGSKRNTRRQIVQISGAVILLAAAGLTAGIALLYANSAPFRDTLVSRFEAASGAKVSMNQFRMNPVTANANSANLVWPSPNVLGKLELGGIVAKHSAESFLGRVFTGEEIVAARGSLDLKAAKTGGEAQLPLAQEGDAKVRFMRYSIPLLNIRFGADPGYWGSLSETEASMFPGISPVMTEIRLRGGALKLRDWPEMTLDRGYMKTRNQELQIQTLRFLTPLEITRRRSERGSVNFSGSISLLDPVQPYTLEAELLSFPVQYLLGKSLGRFFHGNVETQEITDSNFLSFRPETPEEAKLQVTVSNSLDSRLDISGFKFLVALAAILEDDWYELPTFDDEISMVISRQGGRVKISELQAVKRGRMVIRGNLQNSGEGQLQGILRIGLPDTTILASRNPRLDRMFGEVREDYRWIELRISGSCFTPQDDFLELFELASEANTAVPEKEVAVPEPDTFDSLIGIE